MIFDALILGAGPAGLAAASALGRARRHVLVIAGSDYRNRASHAMHGVLACEGMNPIDFLTQSQHQITALYPNIRLESDTVQRAAQIGTPESPAFEVQTATGAVYQGRRLILATGAIDELPNEIAGFETCWPDHIYQCLLCDGFERAERPFGVGVLAKPLSAHYVHLALRARCFNKRVVVYTDGLYTKEQQCETEKLFAPALAQGVTLQHTAISRLEPLPTNKGPGAHIHLEGGKSERVDFLVYKTLTRPASAHLALQLGLQINEIPGHGSVIACKEPTGATSVPGVFVCGDAGSLIKGVAPAMAQGLCVADVVWGGLLEEDKS
ncbi:Pyridine nucleotide-disulfide oxidoreductase class-II [Penicillium canariense]|uniref:Pyridine nucleotide-disulfide oxidoreductase class-II n=1 Tax=Penicillium canariense TaxID=189055 RepID=A0A9W9HME0_9EURO|nr:Pyridine nucleotide-disulfide oxidoreductase class-II [Penicillium canariense]KAJ5151440.1 Pyridine nucleotide-disulfide oxidoreductase class-II [Penicillium canariense]